MGTRNSREVSPSLYPPSAHRSRIWGGLRRNQLEPREPPAEHPGDASSSPGRAAEVVLAPVSTGAHPSTEGTGRWDISTQKASFCREIWDKQVPEAPGRGKDHARSRMDHFWSGTRYS